MNALHELQHEFIQYLVDDKSTDIITRVESTKDRSAAQRVALYGDAYQLRLKEALSTDYERLHAYLGDELFDNVMTQYIRCYPSHYTSLRDYGQHMVVLLNEMPMFAEHPEVVELAQIEQAFANSFDAKDCQHCSLDDLHTVKPELWPDLTFQFSTSVQLLALNYNSFQIWRALSDEETPSEPQQTPATWLIWRRDLITHFRALDEAEIAALRIALNSGTFAEICTVLLDYFDEQDTPLQAVSYIKQWINDRMVCCIRTLFSD